MALIPKPSPLRHSGHAHALNKAFASSTVGWIVAVCISNITIATYGEAWIERKPRIHVSPRFVQPSEPRECGREIEMRDGNIPVCVEAPVHPEDCFGIGTKLRLGKAHIKHPPVCKGIARRKAECLVDVSFSLCASTKEILGKADISMSAGQIAIQRQRLLAFGDAPRCAVRKYLREAEGGERASSTFEGSGESRLPLQADRIGSRAVIAMAIQRSRRSRVTRAESADQQDRPQCTGGRHQAPAHLVVSHDGQQAAVQDDDLFAESPTDDEQRFHQEEQDSYPSMTYGD